MGLRSQLAISAGKTAQWVLKTFFKEDPVIRVSLL